jgi:hypothetical protein
MLEAQYFRPEHYPHVTYAAAASATTRYFPDKLPIGIEKNGYSRHVFLYLVTRNVPVDFRMSSCVTPSCSGRFLNSRSVS